MTKTMVRGAAALLVLTALAGCDKAAPDQPVASENGAVPETNVVEPINEATPAAVTHAATSNASEAAVVREAPIPPDEQTQDDADATGMTSRVNRGEVPANTAANQP
ncbi:MAG: hypothetical protein ABI240_02300 [Sphingomonas sp.]